MSRLKASPDSPFRVHAAGTEAGNQTSRRRTAQLDAAQVKVLLQVFDHTQLPAPAHSTT